MRLRFFDLKFIKSPCEEYFYICPGKEQLLWKTSLVFAFETLFLFLSVVFYWYWSRCFFSISVFETSMARDSGARNLVPRFFLGMNVLA